MYACRMFRTSLFCRKRVPTVGNEQLTEHEKRKMASLEVEGISGAESGARVHAERLKLSLAKR
jgi:hypothetical protein